MADFAQTICEEAWLQTFSVPTFTAKAPFLARSLQWWIVEWKRHDVMDAGNELVEIFGGTDDVV
jgi:hypothetical protein